MNNKKNIFLKVDANNKIGGGHLHRCIALANEFNKRGNFNINFIFSKTPDNHIKKVKELGFNFHKLNRKKQLEIDEYIKIIPINSFILFDTDNPNFYSGRLIDSFKNYNIKTACFTITDKYKISTDILINTNLISLFQKFNTKKSTIHILGPKYLIFSEEFRQLSDFNKKENTGSNLLVFFGNADSNHITVFFIDVLKQIKNKFKEINVLIGGLNNNIEIIEKAFKNENNIRIYKKLNPNEIINLYKKTSLFITAAGMTMWEAALFEIPQIVIASSEREITYTDFLSKKELIYKLCNYSGLTNSKKISDRIISILESEELNNINTQKFRNFIAHDGIVKLCDKLIDNI